MQNKKPNKKSKAGPNQIANRQSSVQETIPVRIFVMNLPYRRTRKFSFWDGFFAPIWAAFDMLKPRKNLASPSDTETFLATTSDHIMTGLDIQKSLRKVLIKHVGTIPVFDQNTGEVSSR